jgi:hypothetical protein
VLIARTPIGLAAADAPGSMERGRVTARTD